MIVRVLGLGGLLALMRMFEEPESPSSLSSQKSGAEAETASGLEKQKD